MTFLILFFIVYSCLVFAFSNIYFLIGCAIFNLLLIIILKVSPKKLLKNFMHILFFVLFVFLFNLIFDSIVSSLIVVFKIVIVTNFAFVFSYRISKTQLANGIANLLLPLKLFKVNTNNLALMIVISLNFISILGKEAKQLKSNLRARNIKLNLKTFFTKTPTIFTMFIAGILKRVNLIEASLKARGYKG